jgi:hypothetical protein
MKIRNPSEKLNQFEIWKSKVSFPANAVKKIRRNNVLGKVIRPQQK